LSSICLKIDQFVFDVPNKGAVTVEGELDAGELLLLRGPSGCGKSTFLKSLIGLLPRQSGKIFVNKRDVSEADPSQRNMGILFQDGALFPFLSVIENISFGLRFSSKGRFLSQELQREKSLSLLKQFSMQDLADKSVANLSGGEGQRVALLRTLILEPALILLDEPFSGIDKENRTFFSEWLEELREKKEVSMLLVSHYDDELAQKAKKVVEWNFSNKSGQSSEYSKILFT